MDGRRLPFGRVIYFVLLVGFNVLMWRVKAAAEHTAQDVDFSYTSRAIGTLVALAAWVVGDVIFAVIGMFILMFVLARASRPAPVARGAETGGAGLPSVETPLGVASESAPPDRSGSADRHRRVLRWMAMINLIIIAVTLVVGLLTLGPLVVFAGEFVVPIVGAFVIGNVCLFVLLETLHRGPIVAGASTAMVIGGAFLTVWLASGGPRAHCDRASPNLVRVLGSRPRHGVNVIEPVFVVPARDATGVWFVADRLGEGSNIGLWRTTIAPETPSGGWTFETLNPPAAWGTDWTHVLSDTTDPAASDALECASNS